MCRILIVSQYYQPEGRTYPEDLARRLTERGHRVRVLTGYPNYPDGELYPGYRQRWRQVERQDGVKVLRVPLFVDHSQSPTRRIVNYLSFGFSSATARDFARGADVVYVYAPQMTAALGPWLWRLTGGAPFVLHIQDLWPDSVVGSSLVENGRFGKAIGSALNPWLRHVYRRAAAVVGIAPNMVGTLAARGVPEGRAHLVYNWSPNVEPGMATSLQTSQSTSLPAPLPTRTARTRFVFAGNTGDMQDLETVVRAAHECRDQDLEVLIVGTGIALPRVRALAAELGAANVKFTGRLPEEQMPAVYEASDFGLVTLKDLPAFEGTIPSKLQALLAAGLPVVTTVRGDVRKIVEREGVGFTADPEDAGSLARALRQAAALTDTERGALAVRARDTFDQHFSLEIGASRLERILVTEARGASGKSRQ